MNAAVYDSVKKDEVGLIKYINEAIQVQARGIKKALEHNCKDWLSKYDGKYCSSNWTTQMLGIVDKTFITDNGEGQLIAKVRVREVRIPNLGDELALRCGQK